MTKRSLFLTVAAGLLASVAFATPSQAGSEYVVTAAFNLVPLPPSTTPVTASDVTITLSGAVPTSGYTVIAPGGLTGVSASGSGDVITINFDPASKTTPTTLPGGVMVEFASGSGIGINSYALSGTSAAFSSSGLNVSISAVPEPTSMALLGIGMTGFLAFRRLFKRNSVA